MRNPNGYGTIVKLSGARRKPYAVRKSDGITEKGYPRQRYLGYFATLKEAKHFLNEYNEGKVDKTYKTVKDVWEIYQTTTLSLKADITQTTERSLWKKFEPVQDKVFAEVLPYEIQALMLQQTPSMAQSFMVLWRNLEKQALLLGIPVKSFGTAITPPHVDSKEKSVFTEEEIAQLWEQTDKPIVCDALILIYTGLRYSEYATLTEDNITDGIITCGIKTENGKNRRIPIHPRILPLLEEKLKFAPSESLVGVSRATMRKRWERHPILAKYTFHECRHTFRTRLDNFGANQKCMDLLLGHKGSYVGERVYNHKTLAELRDTVYLLP